MSCKNPTEGMSYLQAMDWLEKMSKRYEQQKCPKCNVWHVFKRKAKEGL